MKKVILFSFILALLALATVVGTIFYFYSPVNKESPEKIVFKVDKGQTLTQICENLAEKKVVKNALAIKLLAKYRGNSDKIQVGTFELSNGWNLDEIYEALQVPPEQVTITILPGWRREEIAEYLGKQNLPEFDAAKFLDLTEDKEGKLSPDTYKIAPLSTTETIVNLLVNQFKKSVLDNQEIQDQLKDFDYDLDEVITIASLLQREAKTPEQMKMIADIFYSRLKDDYPLQLCASAQYAVGKNTQTGKWWEPPTSEDTQTDSPHNTYVVKGLPPSPICAVSLAAIEAALNPTANDYYFYLHDNEGKVHYGETLEEHQNNIDQYLK